MLLPTVDGRVVLLPSHTDKDLGQPVKHYHVDPRFHRGTEPLIFEDTGQEVVWKERSYRYEPSIQFGIGMYLQLLSIYEGKFLKGSKCPHKEIEILHHGQCQGHGLRFDANGCVLGKISECYLRIKGTRSVSAKGNFEAVKVIDHVQAETLELVYDDQILASSGIGPIGAESGEYIRISFTIGQDASKPVNSSVNESCLPDGFGDCGSFDSHCTINRRTDRITLHTICPLSKH